jgi:hypothetical protein
VVRILYKLWKPKYLLTMETAGELDYSRRLVEFISSSVKGDYSFFKCPKTRIVDSSFRLHISNFPNYVMCILHSILVLRSLQTEIKL